MAETKHKGHTILSRVWVVVGNKKSGRPSHQGGNVMKTRVGNQ